MTELPGLMRNSGCVGADLPSFSLSAWKLFHKATILDGVQGLSSVNAPRLRVRPVVCGAPNMSPSYSAICSPSNAPNPIRPSFDRNRAHCILEHRLEQSRHFRGVSRDLDPALFHDGQLLRCGALPAGYDRARVAHAFSRRRRDAGDESYHRLLHGMLDPRRPNFLTGAADSPP